MDNFINEDRLLDLWLEEYFMDHDLVTETLEDNSDDD
jgi:hypothetical protein